MNRNRRKADRRINGWRRKRRKGGVMHPFKRDGNIRVRDGPAERVRGWFGEGCFVSKEKRAKTICWSLKLPGK